jgi:hypothetical protein
MNPERLIDLTFCLSLVGAFGLLLKAIGLMRNKRRRN